ncbi:MAG: PDZ domain-containing protein [bacterium]|nr:PDZ domain-containing protein [bacterium]
MAFLHFVERFRLALHARVLSCALPLAVYCAVLVLSDRAFAQSDRVPVQEFAAAPIEELETESQGTRVDLREQVQLLNHPSYQARMLAQWRLGLSPAKAMPLLREAIQGADHNTGTRIVDLLTEFALDDNVTVSLEALRLLQETAQELTSVGRMAENSLNAISDLQERQAIEILIHHSATIGQRQFSLNGTLGPETENALHITSEFTGDDDTIQWIRFLKSVETVCLEGPHIDRRYLEAIVGIEGLRNIKLKDVNLTAEDLQVLQGLTDLDHLGLIYVPVDDSMVDLLVELPVNTSMKIYGTKISKEGFARLAQQLDDLQFYYGQGGFLGVSSIFNTLRVRVTVGSAAQQAGMLSGDEIVEVNSKPLQSFLDLREELSEYSAGEQVKITVLRGQQTMVLDVTLKEEP